MSTNQEYDSEQEILKESEEYAFIEEKIKKKSNHTVAKIVAKGLLFGIAASVGFFALKPLFERLFPSEVREVEIPQDEETVNGEGDAENEQTVTMKDYEKLNALMGEVAAEVQDSVVYVNGISGIIVADNGREILVLVNTTYLNGEEGYAVQFMDGTSYSAVMKQSTSMIHMGIVSAQKADISKTTLQKIEVASLGNSNALKQGELLIALGNLYGYEEGSGYGIISSIDQRVSHVDGEYTILVTDIAGSAQSDGFLFDTEGNVVGVINCQVTEKTQASVLTAYGISRIKSEIELMSNGKPVPYIGVKGTIVTETIAAERKIPEGLYVTEVETDSPAMRAGIQNGDILTSIDGMAITTMTRYHSEMLDAEVGSNLTLKGQRYGADSYVEIQYDVIVGKKQ